MRLFSVKPKSDLEARFRAVLSGDKSLHQLAVDHVFKGEPYPIDPASTAALGRPTQTWAVRHRFNEAGTFQGNWIELLALLPDLPPDVQDRIVEVTSRSRRGDWLQATIDLLYQLPTVPFTLSDLERAGSRIGITAEALAASMTTNAHWGGPNKTFSKFSDIDEWVTQNFALVQTHLADPTADSARSWELIGVLNRSTISLFHAELVQAATATSKVLRSKVTPIIKMVPFEAVEGDLKSLATDGDPAARAKAVSLLGELSPPERFESVAQWAEEHCLNDRAKSVRDAVAQMQPAVSSQVNLDITLPDLDLTVKFPSQFEKAAISHEGGNRQYLFKEFFADPGGYNYWATQGFIRLLTNDPGLASGLTPSHWTKIALSSHPNRFSAEYLVKLLEISDGLPTPLQLQVGSKLANEANEHRINRVLQVLADVTFNDQWQKADIEAWALHNTAALEDLLTQGKSWEWDIAGVFKAIDSIENRPASLEKALIECAIAGPKLSCAGARQLLGQGYTESAIEYLKASKAAERTGAASWLREMKDPAAEAALRQALKKEKQDLAKTQMMAALEACGASIEEFTSPQALIKEATKALSKKNGVPPSLSWLPADAIPPVRWADGSTVDPNVILWFLASAVKAKTAEPSPLIRRHFSNMNDEDVRHLGRTLFDLWVSQDTRPPSRAEMEAEARKDARRFVRYAAQYPQHQYYQGKTEDQFFAESMQRLEKYPPSHSATDSKGVLAVVAASGAASLAPKVLSYLKTHRGRRLSQGKAMLQMLSWMDDPAATQVLLNVSQRFRPKGLNKQATVHAEELAERNGWTLDDLADRTVPEGGFEPNGRQVIDYGERTFTAHLSDDLTIRLVNDETGKPIKTLPAPRSAEDEDEVKAVKKDFSAAKKELKATAALQPTRLHQAMCIQRTWEADDFMRYLVGHPVMCRLASRLVWWTAVDDGPKTLFRPLTDTTLLLVDDEEMNLKPDATIGIAHEFLANPGDGDLWHHHMADYEVAPLFAQFNRPQVTADDKNLIDDFRGHMMPEGTFRAQMNKNAWELGQPQDGGWVGEIVKEFAGASLKAVFEHTGVSAGYYEGESLNVGFTVLYFCHAHSYPSQQSAISLSEIPPILLSEIYAEAQAMAHAGSFDPEWEKKCGY